MEPVHFDGFNRNGKCIEANWSNMLEDLLKIIVGKLSYIDFVRFGAICRSWRSIIMGMDHHSTFSDPWLMLPEKEDNSMVRSFYYLSSKRVLEFKLPEAHAKRCVGSTKGWLVMVDETLSVDMVNPVTRVQFKLPHQTTFQDQEGYLSQGLTTEEMRNVFIEKVTLSSNLINSNYMAVAIYSDWQKLAFARVGDETWTTVPCELTFFTDVIYYKEQFYAINYEGFLVSCDIGAHPKTTIITTTLVANGYGMRYLVECSDELLQVARKVEFANDGEFPNYRTTQFIVFKLELSSKLWVEIRSLGECSLFLGCNSSFSFCCNNYPATGVMKNCIYFTDDYLDGHHGTDGTSAGSDKGIFHLEDRHVEPHYPGDGWHPFSLPIWFTPNR